MAAVPSATGIPVLILKEGRPVERDVKPYMLT